MLSRSAWIAVIGCGLLCSAIFAVNRPGRIGHSTIGSSSRIPEVATPNVEPGLVASNQVATQSIASSNRFESESNSSLASVHDHSIQLAAYTTSPIEDRVGFWPSPSKLVEQIESLRNVPETEIWSEKTLGLLEAMTQVAPDSNQLDTYIRQLEMQVQKVPQLAGEVRNRGGNSVEAVHAQCETLRLVYRLQRRIAIWRALQNVESPLASKSSGVFYSFSSEAAHNPTTFNRIHFGGLDPNWVEYLKLEDLRTTFGSLNPNEFAQKKVARSVLARIYSPLLKPEQAAYISQVFDPQIISFLKDQAAEQIEPAKLLKQIEHYEAHPTAMAGYYLNDQYQNLLWSDRPADQALAAELQTHYRNANFRFVVSERLLNRMIPDLPSTAAPVDQTVKGARVSGQSHVSNQLRVNLIPNPNQIQIKLATTGDVRSDTIARTKSFRIQNHGKAQFQVFQNIAIGPNGIDASSRPHALSNANQYVVGVQSKMDNMPVLGWMARKMAAKKLREEAPENNRLFQRTVETGAEEQMREKVNQELAKFRYQTHTKLFKPLFDMDLEPEALQMATTEDQVVMRYRLAGRDQMAANTSRPRDSSKSLLSFQLHQSAINNAIARMGLNGNKFTIDELTRHLRDVIGARPSNSTDLESDQYAEVGFAHFDPIHFELQDDRIRITLNLKSLKVGETGKTWKNISLTAVYRLALDGMTIQLHQDDDGTRIKGKKRIRLGDRAAISTVMKVLFKKQYSMNSIPEKLASRIDIRQLDISQLVISDGWLAVSVDDKVNSTAQKRGDQSRTGAIRRMIQRR